MHRPALLKSTLCIRLVCIRLAADSCHAPHSQRLFLLKLLRTHKSLLYLGWCWEHQHQPQTPLHFLFFFNTLSIPPVPNTRLPFLTPAKPVHLEEPLHFFCLRFFFLFTYETEKKSPVIRHSCKKGPPLYVHGSQLPLGVLRLRLWDLRPKEESRYCCMIDSGLST